MPCDDDNDDEVLLASDGAVVLLLVDVCDVDWCLAAAAHCICCCRSVAALCEVARVGDGSGCDGALFGGALL